METMATVGYSILTVSFGLLGSLTISSVSSKVGTVTSAETLSIVDDATVGSSYVIMID